ncbi:MAG TPA: GNAT family N-acetyltransferase [Rhodanobacteraceae bacterium]|nr:GNAT family N-acetyltransferase [Rhodanobacteraceae bacterium]
MTVRIRRARPPDLDALTALEEASFDHDRVSRAQFRRHIVSNSAAVLVAEERGRVLGGALLFFRRGARSARLYSIAIAHGARGQGLGKALLEAAEREARKRGSTAMRLEVRTDNAAAIALYEKRGYLRRKREPGFYENGMDAWRYRKELGPAIRR